MKKILLLVVACALSFNFSYAKDKSVSEKWTVDTAHSKVGFEIDHLVISSVEGSFDAFSGSLDFNPKSVKSLKVDVKISAKSINTANSKRDKHLRSADFFDVKKFPSVTFKSRKITGIKGKNFNIVGTLEIAGVKKEVTLKSKFLGTVEAYDVKRVAFKAKTSINRSDFGLKWNDVIEAGPVVGEEVEIELKIEAKRLADL